MILCKKTDENDVNKMLTDIRTEMEKTSYSCALGVAYTDKSMDFDSVCAKADAEMYKDKKRYKDSLK